MKNKSTRRNALKQLSVGTAGVLTFAGGALTSCNDASDQNTSSPEVTQEVKALNGLVNHSVCRWCYGDIPLEAFCEAAKEIGLQSIELTGPEEWPILDKYGLTCAMANDSWISLTEGFNNPANHDKLYEPYIKLIDQAADKGLKNVIVFSGNRNGISDEAGIENCAVGLDKIVKHAQSKNVTIVMELLNSKVDHKDYQCDKTPWGAALVDKIGSDHFKLLYDIYHMQIMEGDVIRTIRDYNKYFAHYHTGGVPGRNEINQSQELYYPAILKAITDTGFKGFVAQEFIPKNEDKIASLKEGVNICDV